MVSDGFFDLNVEAFVFTEFASLFRKVKGRHAPP